MRQINLVSGALHPLPAARHVHLVVLVVRVPLVAVPRLLLGIEIDEDRLLRRVGDHALRPGRQAVLQRRDDLWGQRLGELHPELQDHAALLEGVLVLGHALVEDALDVAVLHHLAGQRRYHEVPVVQGADHLDG